MIIDLLAIDMAAGKHWIDLVVEEMRAQRRAEMRAKNRADASMMAGTFQERSKYSLVESRYTGRPFISEPGCSRSRCCRHAG